jgi:membrane fusion protein (multidrug efflux system)
MNTTEKNAQMGDAKRKRLQMLAVSLGAFGGLGAAYGAYWATVLRHHQTTDDAYVNGNIVQITPQISGTVVSIGADDTQFVKAGQPLVQLDQADAKVALDEAEAQLAKTVREVRNLFATTAQLEAAVAVRQTDLAAAQQDLARRQRLGDSGAVSGEELQHARDAVKAAQSSLLSAQQQLAANRARIDNTTLNDHPDVRAASAAVRNAFLTYARTSLPAPVSGFVARRNVQLGERVSPGTPLMAVVPLNQVWIDANFKEPQLAGMRVGQPVTLTADLYGHGVSYHGTVVGFGAGTGAAFSLLPAQNATGNWIKIVQRVPVRIALDPKELAGHPLQIGLSMKADVDVSHEGGERLPQLASGGAAYSTDVFRTSDQLAEVRVRQIIAANNFAGLAAPAKAIPVPSPNKLAQSPHQAAESSAERHTAAALNPLVAVEQAGPVAPRR